MPARGLEPDPGASGEPPVIPCLIDERPGRVRRLGPRDDRAPPLAHHPPVRKQPPGRCRGPRSSL